MPEWSEQITNHKVHDSLRSIRTAVDTILSDATAFDAATIERLHRLIHVIADIISRLNSTDPELLPLQVLNNLQPPLQKIESELSAFQADNNAAHVSSAYNQLENVLVHACIIPVVRSIDDIDSIKEAVTSLRRSFGQNIRHLEDQARNTESSFKELLSGMKTFEAKVAQNQERVDQAVSDVKQRFLTAEEQRSTAFDKSESERNRRSKELYDQKTEEWNRIVHAKQDEYNELYDKFDQGFKELNASLQNNAQEVLSALNAFKAKAQKLVGVITDTGMVGGYQKEANASKRAATFWRFLAASSLVGLIAFAVIVFNKSHDGATDVSWPIVGWRVFVATAFGLLAAYAALQADKHDRTKKIARKMELELAAISPYLQDLPIDKQIALKVELAQKLFGQVELPSPKVDKKTTGSIVDILKMAMEAIESLAHR